MEKYKLGDCLKIKHGWAFKGEYFAESGTQSILTPGNFFEAGGFKYNDERERFYTGNYPSEYLCKKGDLIVAMTEQVAGLLGSTAIVPKDDRYLHNQRIGLVTCDEKILTKMYAYYLFMTKSVREQIGRTSSGTKVKHTSPERIYDVEVSLPSIPTQKKIADFLWAIECKITNNNQINDNLQHQIKLIYDYWFTQFDFPDENGKPYRSSGGVMVWNEQLKRKIPINWQVINIRDISNITWGQCPDGKNILDRTIQGEDLFDYCSGAGDMKGGFLVDCQAKTDNSKRFAHKNDILVSIAGKIGDMCVVDHTISLGRAAMAYTAKDSNQLTFIYMTLQSLNRKMAVVSTGSIQKVINNNHIDSFIFPYEESIVSSFGNATGKIFEKLIAISHENKQLTALRDWLLPMLMNGQATVTD